MVSDMQSLPRIEIQYHELIIWSVKTICKWRFERRKRQSELKVPQLWKIIMNSNGTEQIWDNSQPVSDIQTRWKHENPWPPTWFGISTSIWNRRGDGPVENGQAPAEKRPRPSEAGGDGRRQAGTGGDIGQTPHRPKHFRIGIFFSKLTVSSW